MDAFELSAARGFVWLLNSSASGEKLSGRELEETLSRFTEQDISRLSQISQEGKPFADYFQDGEQFIKQVRATHGLGVLVSCFARYLGKKASPLEQADEAQRYWNRGELEKARAPQYQGVVSID